METNKPQEPELEGGGHTWWFVCPECHLYLERDESECPCCHTKLEWRAWKGFKG